ncbi:MAG: hypothetical protein ACKOZW_05110 [Cyanobium sp.]
MNHPGVPTPPPSEASSGDPQAEAALAHLEQLARELEGQPDPLLALLRRLEQLHRNIQDGPFRNSLPADRNDLFRLLAEMERSGGWPYIPRLQLRTFLDLLQREEGSPADGASAAQDSLAA